ncbi:MAG: aspartyl-tRNA(Asn)/glutamyl-tRNA(Gln) amidotransferase subunit [Clostridia bacterium]|jgi:aspartyl-tRNA(Asn)/glutamyl-tRNA(Gln) amidotransferase subunit A|uniref:Glutamyl-tRNA(Gln) amidotransferase subunit A n=1 Tax=Thermacetogenium phaeum TaxID=85874 RepID=A0A124FK98_9THEO|nr:MAG: Glutamyl-tRNA(Gln) amidotransferase subunit A [Thermacetogenium phaeum]MDK2880409.1 aspartyl-tRNA(Asn)/glutamyl-tRNA(Gln) amidotransferase subunit [Clostridia bacterium]MDN5366530.1 aspartyl-tRNA(Asn)/glutamyl-tRNA(Gln) amidotransferase subunit [Thermacetogenium sp.]
MELFELTAHELADLIRRGETSAEELTDAVFKRIDQVEDDVRAYVTVTREQALAAARAVDARRQNGEDSGPLAGIPVGLKDNLCTQGVRTTCASRMLENFVPPYNATVVEKLYQAGAVVTGKLNMDEFAMGSTTEYSAFFPTRNPWDLSRVPGGSSGGAAAAVAAGEAIYALGSDTGGSIRQPASFCGVVGMKPTYGLVSRYGLVAFASSLDQVGSLTRDVRDCALVLNAIAGHDPLDSTSVPMEVPDYTSFLTGEMKGKRIGVIKEMFDEGLDPEVAEVVKKGVKKLEELGGIVEECSFPHAEYAIAIYYIIAPAEASSNLARFDGIRYGYRANPEEGKELDLQELYLRTRSEGFGPEVKRRILVGTYALSSGYYDAYYLKALKVRTLIREDYRRLFQNFDLLVSPTAPCLPFPLGEKLDDPIVLYLADVYTVPVNLAGLPAISLPCGFVRGLPVGMQLIAPAFKEGDLLQVAYAFEQNTPYHKERPPLQGKSPAEAVEGGELDGRI